MAAKRKRTKTTKRKYSPSASADVEQEMHEFKRGEARSGRSGKKVKSRKQAIAIGLSKARRKGKRVPAAPSKRKRS
ncbi:MAG: DUF6496 domain-containing protein [Vulcanimicrobiaceae bacterium]